MVGNGDSHHVVLAGSDPADAVSKIDTVSFPSAVDRSIVRGASAARCSRGRQLEQFKA
jgi:hypothetical protein